MSSKEYWPREPGFDFAPKGWCLPIDTQWNSGIDCPIEEVWESKGGKDEIVFISRFFAEHRNGKNAVSRIRKSDAHF
jgi:hypothetical protein